MENLEDFDFRTRQFLIWAVYGRAMMGAHRLEKKLSLLLVQRATDICPSGELRDQEIKAIDRLTLGPLINRFLTEFSASENLAEELDNMLFSRNELTHRISDMALNAADRHTQWTSRLIEEIENISTYFSETCALLEPYSKEWMDGKEITQERLDKVGARLFPNAHMNLSDTKDSRNS